MRRLGATLLKCLCGDRQVRIINALSCRSGGRDFTHRVIHTRLKASMGGGLAFASGLRCASHQSVAPQQMPVYSDLRHGLVRGIRTAKVTHIPRQALMGPALPSSRNST